MKFYEKYYASNYEELITYYPRFYRDVFEMMEILKAHGRIADGMEENIEQAFLNGFIDYADEAVIEKLEKFLEIGLNRSRTLEERRRLVKSYFVGFGKLSASKLNEIIWAYMRISANIELIVGDEEGNQWLFIRLNRDSDETLYIGELRTIISKKIPANIKYMMNIQYDTNIYLSDLEKVEFIHLDMHVFFYYLKRVLNGDWLLDGSVNLGQIPICEIDMGIAIGNITVAHGRKACFAALDIPVAVPAALPSDCCSMENGYGFDSSGFLDVGVEDIGVNVPLRVEARVEADSVTIEKDLWRLDGQVLLDGSRILDAKVWKEEL